ncbi:hypothetical protein COOONC_03321 [Cooperia oncophora]
MQCYFTSFRPEEWADIVSCFSENRCLPADLIERYCPTDIWKRSSETAFKAASESNKAESLLLRSNRSSLVSTGLLGRILNSLWPRDRLSLCVEQLLADKRPAPDEIILNNAVHVYEILDSDWVSLGPSTSTLAIPFIAGALACLDSAMSAPDTGAILVVDLPLGCSLVESVIRSSAPFSSNDAETFEHIFNSFARLLLKSSRDPTQLMRLVKALEGLSVWIDFTAAKCSQLPFALWSAVNGLLTLLDQHIEQGAKEVIATSKAVPIASPEEPTNDDTVAGNWLECILEQVPAMLDHQSAVQSQIVSEMVEISKRIEFLLRLLANARDMSKCNKCICDVVEKIQNLLNAEIVGEFQSTYITLSQGGLIGADLQAKLLQDVLSRGGQQKTLLLRTIISGGRSNRPHLVAQIFRHSLDCYEKVIGTRVMERLCKEECTILEEFSHFLKKTHATDFARQTMSLLDRILADENSSFILLDDVTSLLLTLVHRNPGTAKSRMVFDFRIIVRSNLLRVLVNFYLPQLFLSDFTNALPYTLLVYSECPWTLDLKMLGRIESEWSKVITLFSEFFLRHPSQSFLPGTYSLLISEHFCGAEETLDLPVLLFVLRHLPRLICEQGQKDVQNFNNHQPGMETIIKQFVHPDNVSKLGDRAVKLFTETIHDGSWQVYIQGFILTVLIIESTGNRLGAALFESLTILLHNIDVHAIKDACINLEATGGIDRLHCMLSIFRNTAFCDLVPCFEEQCRQALKEDVSQKLHRRNNHRCTMKSDLSSFYLFRLMRTFFVKGDGDTFLDPPINVDEYLLHQHLRHEIATLLLHEVQEKWKNRPDKDVINAVQVKWVVRVASSGQYTRDVAERAEQELSKLGAENAAEVRFCYLAETLLAGATSAQAAQNFEKKPLLGIFCSFYEAVLCSEKVRPSWIEDHLIALGDTLDRCASGESASEQTALTPAFIQVLSNVLHKDSTSELSKQLRCLLAGRLLFLPSWLRCSHAPSALILSFAPILQDLKEHVDAEVMHCAMRDSVAAILRPSLIEDLHDFFAITVQSTDRLAQTALTWTGRLASEYRSRPSSLVPLKRRQDVFHEVLMVICNHADSETHIEVLRQCAENLASWIEVSTEEENVMRGQALLTNGNRLVFRLMVVSNLLEYCSQLEYSNTQCGPDCPPNSGRRRKMMSSVGQIAFRSVHTRRLRKSLYISTGTIATRVRMTDNKGVCSVCAVNCHRGHDLSYSKQGSFFCDCGAGGCSALKATVYHNSPISAARGRTAPAVHTAVDSGTTTPVSFDINLDTTVDSSELLELLVCCFVIFFMNLIFFCLLVWKLRKVPLPPRFFNGAQTVLTLKDRVRAGIESRVEVIERIIRASLHARDSRWSLDERRDNVRRSLADPQRLNVVYDQAIMEDYEISGKPNSILEPRRPPEPPTDRNKARDICQVLPFENGCHLWFMLAEHATTLQIFHMHPGQSLVDELEHMRIDSEPIGIGFAGRQVSCRDDKVAVAGPSDILTLRMSKDGEIVDRMVLWAPHRPALLAVATVQLVRIYDLALDADNFVEELVLPVDRYITHLSPSYCFYHWRKVPRLSNTHLKKEILGREEFTVFELTQVKSFLGVYLRHLKTIEGEFRLEMTTPVHCWQESSGVMACFSYPIASSLVFVYPTLEQILIQRIQLKRSAFAHALFTGSSADIIYSLPLFYDSPTNLVFSARWSTLPDLWIENMPSEMCAQAEKEKEEPEAELQDSDLVTLFERCEPVDRVEVSCPDLAIFYDVHDLNVRLSSVGSMPVTAIQKEQFALTMRVGDPNIIVRAVRIELPSERGRGPSEVSIGDKTYPLTMTTDLARFFDIRFTRTQSLELDHRNITLTFSGRSRSQVGMTVVSVRLYGMSKREFGSPRSHLIARMPLSLPDKFILNVIRMMTALNTRNLFVKVSLALFPAVYDLAVFSRGKVPIPSDLMADFALQLKYMMCTRWKQFWSIVKRNFTYSPPCTTCRSDPHLFVRANNEKRQVSSTFYEPVSQIDALGWSEAVFQSNEDIKNFDRAYPACDSWQSMSGTNVTDQMRDDLQQLHRYGKEIDHNHFIMPWKSFDNEKASWKRIRCPLTELRR